jgi:L-alanine-DL-glutamate epimerase-like enolase superfamily enzyme
MADMTTIDDVQVLTASDPALGPVLDVVQDVVLVGVRDVDGTVGYGESQTSPAIVAAVLAAPANRAMSRRLKSLVIGRSCTDVDGIMADLRGVTRVVGREGVVSHALSALEAALWDLLGQVGGEPLWRLLSRPGHQASGPRAYGTTWFSDSRELLAESLAAMRAHSLSGVKVAYRRDAVPSPDEEASVLRWLRGELGPSAGLSVDWQSQGSVDDLLRRLEVYDEVSLGWIEEPFDRDGLAEYEKLAASAPMPLAAGESETRLVGFRAFLDAGVTVLQPDLGRCGLQVATQAAEISKAAGVSVVPHQWGSNLNRAVNVHWAIAQGLELTERRLDPAPLVDSLIRWDAPVSGECYDIPTKGGAGAEIDATAFQRLN